MHETFLQNEREFEEKFCKIKICNACLNEKCDYSQMDCPCYQDSVFLDSNGGKVNTEKQLKSHNRTSLIKVMKALEKELEINQEDARKYPLITDGKQDDRYNAGYENALQLAIDKIENFINKIQ